MLGGTTADNHPLKAGNATSAYLAQQRAIENFYDDDWYQSQMTKKRKAAQKERAVQQALNQGGIDRQVQGIPIDTIGVVQPKRTARIPILIEED